VIDDIKLRAARHDALGDPLRLAIVDELMGSDRSPNELRRRFGLESNLLAHHLGVLEAVGIIVRSTSSGDGRRRYVHVDRSSLHGLLPTRTVAVQKALFVCTRNSARSQLASVLWHSMTGATADSAGTRPSERVHSGAIAAAARVGLDLSSATPRSITTIRRFPSLVITVCDQAHEQLEPGESWLHWSLADPVASGRRAGFDATVVELRERIAALTAGGGR